ncbi:hypothetical protein FB446DRAFT_745020 [Lentinula raphanica]|nr:hypothetical protein FB446DRAFT_745020 [Lentinula raphanica]
MVITIPHEIVDCILDNLQEAETLSNCALVQKSWAVSAQRGLFRHLSFGSSNRSLTVAQSQNATIERVKHLIEIFETKPYLASCVRTLELTYYRSEHDLSTQLVSFIIPLVEQLRNVNSLILSSCNWGSLCLELRRALMHLLSQPSLIRLILSGVYGFSNMDEVFALLSLGSNLKTLKIMTVSYGDRVSFTEDTIPVPHENHPRSIQLDQSLLLDYHAAAYITWFQQVSCPFEIRNLRCLHIGMEKTPDEWLAWMLQYIGENLQELTLSGLLDQPSTSVHVSHTPNLRSLVAIDDIDSLQKGKSNTLPWILNFFRCIPESDVQVGSSLVQLSIDIRCWQSSQGFNRRHMINQLDGWTALDTLFTERRFDSLELIDINLLADSYLPMLKKFRKVILGKMPLLKDSGKLEVNSFLYTDDDMYDELLAD